MKKILLVRLVVCIIVFLGCVSNENQALIDDFVVAANEELASASDVVGIGLSKCEYRDNAICYDFQLNFPDEYIDEIDSEELKQSYFDALKTNADSEEVYYPVFKAMKEEGCVLRYRFATPSGKEVSFEINPRDLIE